MALPDETCRILATRLAVHRLERVQLHASTPARNSTTFLPEAASAQPLRGCLSEVGPLVTRTSHAFAST